MRLTNKLELPDSIYQAVKNDPYDSGDCDFSVTSLLKPARIRTLEFRHKGEIVEDVSDRIFSLLGQSIHMILERANKKGISERRLSMLIDGFKISGGMDLYSEDGIICDYKVTSKYSVKNGVKLEHIQQLNCYAEILRQNKIPVNGLKIIALLRDWSKMDAVRDKTMPSQQVVILNVPMWSEEKTLSFIRERIRAHVEAKDDLPLCTPEERWEDPPVYAVMKRGRVKAIKLYGSLTEAEMHLETDPELFVVHRDSKPRRCQHYCSVNNFCDYYKNLISPINYDYR